MSIVHDAYLFNPQPFALTLVDHARCLANDDRQGYRGLRAAAIQSFDGNALTRELADQYGGWDRAAILDELTEQGASNPDAVAFCYLLLLYGHLVPPLPQNSLGLCTSWRACAKSLERMACHKGQPDW